MADGEANVMSMTQIILIMVGVSLVLGIVVGTLGGFLGISPTYMGAGVGASVGLIGVLLLNKRKAALAARPPER